MRWRRWARPAEAEAEPPAPAPVPASAPSPTTDIAPELVRVLEVVTTMCSDVIDFVETDREERRLAMQSDREERRALVEALSMLITRIGETSAVPAPPRERVIGGSMPAGPLPPVDLRDLHDDAVHPPTGH